MSDPAEYGREFYLSRPPWDQPKPTRRDPRRIEDYFPPEVVAAVKAGHAQYIRNLPNFAKWDELPIESQDDWILIWREMHRAYKAAGGE